jgi:adenylate cyclase
VSDDELPPEDPEALRREGRRLARRVLRLEQTLAQVEQIRDTNARVLARVMSELDAERLRSRELLLNVLPAAIVERLDAGETLIADEHERVAVLFSDFVGFTAVAATLPAATLLSRLNSLFSAFDSAAERHGVEKIKTIGDAYMAVAGLTPHPADPVHAIADVALEMVATVEAAGAPWAIRIGIHVGPAVAGVIGTRKFAYDVWGDTVNVASRLESTSPVGRIHVSEGVADGLVGRYRLEPRGGVELKGKGTLATYLLLGEVEERPAPGPTLAE